MGALYSSHQATGRQCDTELELPEFYTRNESQELSSFPYGLADLGRRLKRYAENGTTLCVDQIPLTPLQVMLLRAQQYVVYRTDGHMVVLSWLPRCWCQAAREAHASRSPWPTAAQLYCYTMNCYLRSLTQLAKNDQYGPLLFQASCLPCRPCCQERFVATAQAMGLTVQLSPEDNAFFFTL
jgi:hypothetical protein